MEERLLFLSRLGRAKERSMSGKEPLLGTLKGERMEVWGSVADPWEVRETQGSGEKEVQDPFWLLQVAS